VEVLVIATNTAHQINEEIRDKEVRLIGSSGEQMGIMSAADARKHASAQGLDLVKISPNATPPVCKIMDYGKFKFEQAKKEKEAKKNQHVTELKEIRLSPNIGDNDFNWKLNDGRRFLSGGDRLKVTVRFRRGREMAHTNIGEALLDKYVAGCSDIAVLDKQAKLEGTRMSLFLTPKTGKAEADSKKSNAQKQKAEPAPKAEADSQPAGGSTAADPENS